MDMLIGGKHISSDDLAEVKNPYNGEVIDTVPIAHRQIADLAITEANNAKESLQEMSAFKVSNKLFDVVEKLKDNREDFAHLLTLEVGKPINESLVELDRSIETLKLAAEEAKRIYGESVPLDAGLNGKGFFAFTQKLPLGVVAAITPFNYPLNLTIHKIAPAIACKNTVIIKPPTEAPLTVMKFAELLNEEFPDGVVNTVTGYGSEIGDYLVTSDDVNKISFTGSVTTGLMISQKAGMKKDAVLRTKFTGEKPNADPRKWELASKILYKTNKPEIIRSLVGEEVTQEFISFCKQKVITLAEAMLINNAKSRSILDSF